MKVKIKIIGGTFVGCWFKYWAKGVARKEKKAAIFDMEYEMGNLENRRKFFKYYNPELHRLVYQW